MIFSPIFELSRQFPTFNLELGHSGSRPFNYNKVLQFYVFKWWSDPKCISVLSAWLLHHIQNTDLANYQSCDTLYDTIIVSVLINSVLFHKFIFNYQGDCYNTSDLGQSYTGRRAFTQRSELCDSWSNTHLLFNASLYPELRGTENFCRNPGRLREKPWCFTSRDSWDYCNLPTNCTSHGE